MNKQMNMDKRRKAYKGFDKDFKCRGFQYEVGKEYEHQGNIGLCENGFHACENPFDVLDYYGNILDHRYCEVEQSGQIESEDKKSVSSKIAIKAEIGFAGLFKAGIEYLKEITSPEKIEPANGSLNDDAGYGAQIGSSGDCAQIGSSGYGAKIGSSGYGAKIGSSGDCAQIGSSGDCAQIGSSGDCAKIGSSGYGAQIGSSGDCAKIGSSGDCAQIGSSGYGAKIGSSGYGAQIDSSGDDSIICCAGHGSMAKAKVGSWITLSEWVYSESKNHWVPKCVKTEYVDGERIKADTWYGLKDGEFYEITG